MVLISDTYICDHLQSRDYEWFYTAEGRDAVTGVYSRLSLSEQDELNAALSQRNYSKVHSILGPLVCPTKPKSDPKRWLVPVAIAILLLLLLWWLLSSCLDDWQRNLHHEATPSPSPTATASPAPVKPTTFAVFFGSGSSALDAADLLVLRTAAQDVSDKAATVTLVGMTDGTGSAQLNAALAQARAKQVQAVLVQHGVDPSQVTVKTHPQAAQTTDGQARRVDIVVVPNQ